MAKQNCTRTFECRHCGGEFSGRKRKYCSTACNQAAYRARKTHDPKGHKCHECGDRFTGRKRKYCSEGCAYEAHQRQKMDLRRAKGVKPKTGNPREYYRSAEYKRIQRFRQARREGRPVHHRPLPEYRPIWRAHQDRMKAWRRYLAVCRRVDRRVSNARSRMMPAEAWRWRYRNDPEFRAKQKERLLAKKHRRRHDRKLRSDGTVTGDVIGKARSCLYCGNGLNQDNRTIDHLIPLNRGGLHSASNVVECCRSCNSTKLDKPFDEWVDTLPADRAREAVKVFERLRGAPRQQKSLI